MAPAKIKAESVTDVQAATKKMFAAINAAQPEGIRYASVLLPDGETFVALLTVQYAAAFPQMRINAVNPGYTATDFNAHRGTQTVEEGAEAIVRYALLTPEGPTGGLFDKDGAEAW